MASGIALLACGCRGEPTSEARDAAKAASSAPVVPVVALDAAAPKRVHWTPVLRHPHPRCRSIATYGRVEQEPIGPTDAGAAPIAIAGEIPRATWVVLGPDAKLTTKDPRSGRELSFEGRGRIRPCEGENETWLVAGTLSSVPGAGEAPGQEQWIATPLGVVRYAGAIVKVTSRDGVDIQVASGSASIWASDGASAAVAPNAAEDGWRRLPAGAKATLAGAVPLDRAVATCISAAKSARDLAEQIAVPDAALVVLAPRHVNARQIARAACTVARLRAESLPQAAAKTLLATINEAYPPVAEVRDETRP